MNSSADFPKIRALLLDSDGVLTDGGVYQGAEGQQMRRFDIKDGLGLVRLQAAGVPVAIISASPATPVLERARTLGIKHAYVGERDKVGRAKILLSEWGISPEEVAFIGDDLTDQALLEMVGFPITVANASTGIRSCPSVCYTTEAKGGYGAVREVCDLILGPNLKAAETASPSI